MYLEPPPTHFSPVAPGDAIQGIVGGAARPRSFIGAAVLLSSSREASGRSLLPMLFVIIMNVCSLSERKAAGLFFFEAHTPKTWRRHHQRPRRRKEMPGPGALLGCTTASAAAQPVRGLCAATSCARPCLTG